MSICVLRDHQHNSTSRQSLHAPIRCIIVASLLLALHIRIEQLVDRLALVRERALRAVAQAVVRVSVEISFGSLQSQL